MRWKFAAVGGWVVVGVVLMLGAGDKNEVRTRRLVVEDSEGRPFCVIEDANGKPSVKVLDRQGRTVASMPTPPRVVVPGEGMGPPR